MLLLINGQQQHQVQETISFKLNGTHYEEDEVSDVARGLHWNITQYQPLPENGTTLINVQK